MHSQEVCKYIIVCNKTTVAEEIGDENFFDSSKEAEEWIRECDPHVPVWDIFAVDISHIVTITAKTKAT